MTNPNVILSTWLIIASLLSLAAPLAAELNHLAKFPAGATDLQQQFAKPPKLDTEAPAAVITEQTKTNTPPLETKIPNVPFSIMLQDGWQIDLRYLRNDAETYQSYPEYNPSNGIMDNRYRHIHIYQRPSRNKTPDDGIHSYDTRLRQWQERDIQSEKTKWRKYPFLLKTEDFSTQSGLTGRLAYFGYPQKNTPDKIKEQKFFFNYQGKLYCLCMEAPGDKDEDWAELRSIVINTLKPLQQRESLPDNL
jgi:hypothetical protein